MSPESPKDHQSPREDGEEALKNPLEGLFVDEQTVRSLYTYLVERRADGHRFTPVRMAQAELNLDYHQMNEAYVLLRNALSTGMDLDRGQKEPVFRWELTVTASQRTLCFFKHIAVSPTTDE